MLLRAAFRLLEMPRIFHARKMQQWAAKQQEIITIISFSVKRLPMKANASARSKNAQEI